MASFIEMSLEDIIQKKKKEFRPKKLKTDAIKLKTQLPQKGSRKIPINDARNKIILKKRTQINDAREILTGLAKQKDARLKLEQLRQKRRPMQQYPGQQYLGQQYPGQQYHGKNVFQNRDKFIRTIPHKDRVFIDSTRQVVSQPLQNNRPSNTHFLRQHSLSIHKFIENRTIGSRPTGSRSTGHRSGKIPTPKPILRTVENDIEIIEDDPMGDEDLSYHSKSINPLNRKASLQLKIIAHNNDALESRGSRTRRSAAVEREKSPPRPPSILKKRPMAALRSEKADKPEKPALEFRIIVSNLRSSVTGSDIQELFGDVGGMVESRLVRPGTAEVIYKTQEDAQRAVDLYHNRQLDGQPMTCLLVAPRTNALPSSSSKPALYSTNSNVEPDISTFHKVLFSNF